MKAASITLLDDRGTNRLVFARWFGGDAAKGVDLGR
jgi:hypothetical protein